MPSVLNAFLMLYYQLPGTKPEGFLLPVTLETRVLNCLGTGLTNPKPTRPLLWPCSTGFPPAWSTSQLRVRPGCSFTSPPPAHLPCPIFHSSTPATKAGPPHLSYSNDASCVCVRTLEMGLSLPCFIVPEVSPAPITLHHSLSDLSTTASPNCGL